MSCLFQNKSLTVLSDTILFVGAGYLACARCSSTGSLVLIEPIATVNGGDQPLSPPRTERCLNCSGAGKVTRCSFCICRCLSFYVVLPLIFQLLN